MGVFAGSTLSFNQREIEKDANFFASGGTATEIQQNYNALKSRYI